MTTLFRLPDAAPSDPRVDAWFAQHDPSRQLVAPWFAAMRGCGADVCVTIHDGQPTACIGDIAFAYVDAFTAHANIGFFHGNALPDPAGLLEGSGKRMRHVKLRPGRQVDPAALHALIAAAYHDLAARIAAGD